MLSKNFLSKIGNENTAQSYFKKDIWLQIKALFSPCCGLGRKLVGLKDSNGNKIVIDGFPFTFDGTTYATKELFEQAMADAYGAGYSASLVDCCRLMFIWNRGLTEVPDYIEEGAASPYNFDIEMDWSILLDVNGNPYPVTDQNTFEQWLTDGTDPNGEVYNDLTSIVVTDFIMTGNRIQCNLSANGITLALNNANLINYDGKIGNISGLEILALNGNGLTSYNPATPYITTLKELYLCFNQLVAFNPTLTLPITMINLNLENNQMTTAGYSLSEVWANSQPAFTSTCIIGLQGNINSAAGTNLETILTGKNCNVQV